MSDATERPGTDRPGADEDAWRQACAEDLAAEQERRRARYGTPPGSAAEELRKLLDAVTGKLAEGNLLGATAQGVEQAVRQARAAVEPVIERNPEVFGHLAAAGSELLAAYRSAVERQESGWTRGTGPGATPPARKPEPGSGSGTGAARPGGPRDDEGPGPAEHIDLD
ncbi:DUF5304 domain-containing protein [Streptomyces sp. NPDC058372]|uniref:DUF5304 domain-containing protein n=1 Tax=Streptomyces sp. NPDC058372 TaxID=3346464 RepID=UPI00364AB8D8